MRKYKKIFLIIAGIFIVPSFIFFLNHRNAKLAPNQPSIKEDKLLQYFSKIHPNKHILTYIEGDVDDDGTKDLIAVYNVEKSINKMVVIVDKQGEFKCSNEVSAPATNPKLQFKDYDNKPTNQFILSGSDDTGTFLGFAMFNLENMKIVDIFDSGMEGCCD